MSSIESLPPELIHEIVKWVDNPYDHAHTSRSCQPQDLANLRHTCKKLSNAAAVPLFRAIPVWLERDSLNNLLECSNHPFISTCVKWLNVSGERVSPYTWEGERNPDWAEMRREVWDSSRTLKQLRERASDKPKEIDSEADEGENSVLNISYEIEEAKDALNRRDFQKRMETEALDISMLSEAFGKLPKLAILNFEYTDEPPGSWDLTEMGFEVYDPGIPWRCHVFQTFLQALARAKCKPQSIMWQNEGSWQVQGAEGLPIWALNDLNLLIDQKQMSRLLSNLRVLRLERTWHGLGLGLFAVDDALPGCTLGNFVELCPQLEVLYLSFGHYYTGCTSRNLMGRKAHRNLRDLTFECLIIDLAEVVNCLIRNESLERVSLDHISLASGNWPTFLDELRGTPLRRLRSLDLFQLTTEFGGDDWGWRCDEQDILDYIHGKTQTNPYKQSVGGWCLSPDWSSPDFESSESASPSLEDSFY